MARSKKKPPNRSDQRYEVKRIVGHSFDGKPIRKSFYSTVSIADAERKANEYEIQQQAHSLAGLNFVDKSIAFDVFALKWLEIFKKPMVDPSTYRTTYYNTVCNHLIPYFQGVPIDRIQPMDVQNFYNQNTKMSASLADKCQMCLRSIFDAAIDQGLCGRNPAKSKTLKMSFVETKESDVYSEEEIDAINEFFINDAPEIVLILNTGLRRGEMLGLLRTDIDLNRRLRRVQRSIADTNDGSRIKVNKPKWNSKREIPLNDVAVKALQKAQTKNNILFPTKNMEYQSPNSWARKYGRNMERLRIETGIRTLSPHKLRHTFGTSLRRRGADIFSIQKIMGHKDIQVTTEIYVKNEFESLVFAINSAYKDNMHNIDGSLQEKFG